MLWPCPCRGCLGGCVRLANLERRTPSIFGNARYSQKTEVEPEHDPVKKGDYIYMNTMLIVLSYCLYTMLNHTLTIHQQIMSMKVFRRLDLTFAPSNMSICLAYSAIKKSIGSLFSGFLKYAPWKRRDLRISHFQWLLAPNNVSTGAFEFGSLSGVTRRRLPPGLLRLGMPSCVKK